MSAQDLEQRARELLAAESRGRREADTMLGPDVASEAAIRAIVAALRQQPAPVDLEQFREIAEGLRLADQFFDGDDSHWQWDDGEFFPASKVRAAHKRLLALIDNAGKVECAEPVAWITPESIRHLAKMNGPANVVVWNCASGNARVPLYAAPHQPAHVVDDARMARALEWVRAECGFYNNAEARTHMPAIEEAIAAYNPSCGARTVRVVDDAMVDAAIAALDAPFQPNAKLKKALARAQGVQS